LERKRSSYVAALLLLAWAVAAHAGDGINAGYEKKIREFMQIIGAQNITRQVASTFTKQLAYSLKQQHPDIDPKAFAVIEEETDAVLGDRSQQIIEKMIPIYSKHFTEEDIDDLLTFYHSRVGRKTIREMPALMAESMEMAVEESKTSVPEIQKRTMAKLEADGLIKKDASAPPRP
jgi:hypothetical protein